MKLFNRNIIPIAILLFLSSCATILNGPIQKIAISTDKNIKILSVDRAVYEDSSFINIDNTKEYYVPRSNLPIEVDLLADSLHKTITINPNNSFGYWFNIYATDGIGMLVDKDNIKRFGYPKRSYLSLDANGIRRKNFAPIRKGSVNLSLSYPIFSAYFIKTINGNQATGGVLGLEAGLDYFYRDDKYFSLNFGAATDMFGEYMGTGYRQTTSVLYINLMNNQIVGSFDFGYGVNISRPKWVQKMGDDIDYWVKSTQAGPSLSAHYRVGYYFRIGMLYQPMLFNIDFNKSTLDYQHYFSINLLWKLPLHRE